MPIGAEQSTRESVGGHVALLARGSAGVFGGNQAGPRPRIGPARNSSLTRAARRTSCCVNAANHAQDRQWSEAINIYQRVIDQFGDKVAKLPKERAGADASGDFVLYVDERRFCHAAIAHLPPEAREIYRNRIDGLAERWFRQGASQRDLGLLRRVVDQAFCSSWGDDALELLGDLAFQDGRFGEALAMYRRLVPDRPGDAICPGPSRSFGRSGAGCRQENSLPRGRGRETSGQGRARRSSRGFTPAAAGALAGRNGNLCGDSRRIAELGSSGPAVAARQPVADVRGFAHAVEGRRRAD